MINLLKNRPVFAQYAITSHCNSKCRSCEYWRKGSQDELSLDEMGSLAGQLWEFGVRVVTVTGGEPFLRKDAIEIIRLFQKRGFRVTVNTNGILVDEKLASQLAALEKLHVVVSLDSLDGATYKALRGVDALDAALNGMSLLKQNTHHDVRVHTVVSAENYQEVPDILSFCKKNDYLFSVYPVMAGSRKQWFSSRSSLSKDDRESVAALFHQLSEQARRDPTLFGFSKMYSGAARFLRGEDVGTCGAGTVLLQVSPEGKISPCPELEPFCDIRTERLDDAYRAVEWRKIVGECARKTPCYIGCTRTLQTIRGAPVRFISEKLRKSLKS